MFSLLSSDRKAKKVEQNATSKVKEIFNSGRFPVVTTQKIEDRQIAKVLGLVCCRGFDADEAFYGMLNMAMKKGAQGIIAYSENVSFHPDGSKYYSFVGTAVMFEKESREDLFMLPYPSSYSRPKLEERSERVQERNFDENKGRMFSARIDDDDDPVLRRLIAAANNK